MTQPPPCRRWYAAAARAVLLRERLASGGWLDRRRLRRWSGAFLAVHLMCGLLIAAGSHGWLITLHGSSGTTDFVSFYAAGTLASGPVPASVYDRAAHYAAERAATSPGIPYVYFFYPPVFLLYCRALAWLPYLGAFFAFECITLCCYLAAMRSILGARARGWLLPLLGFAPLLWNFGFGQNACMTAALFGAGCALLRRQRSLAAGLVLGLLLYKPHTALLLPVALFAARDWRAIAGAFLSVAGSVALCLALFGWAAWSGFVHAIGQAQHEFAGGVITPFAAMVNLSAALRDHGVAPQAAGMAQLAAQGLLTLCVAWCWWRSGPRDLSRYAVLASAAVLMMPVVLFYDLALLTIAAGFIVADARTTGFLRYEKSALAGAWLAGGLCYPLARAWHLPLGLGCCLLVLAASVRRHAAPNCRSVNTPRVRLTSAKFDQAPDQIGERTEPTVSSVKTPRRYLHA